MTHRIKKYKKRTISDEHILTKQMEVDAYTITEDGFNKKYNLGDINDVANITDTMSKYAEQKPHAPSPVPYTMTEEVLIKFFEAINVGASYDTACNYAEISRGTFYKWLQKAKEDIMADIGNSPYVAFMTKLHKVEADYEINLLKDIQTMIKERDPFVSQMLKYLAVKFPKKWGSVH